jgi:CBS domain-containing protein
MKKGICIVNILFFLTPKADLAYLLDTESIAQALAKMEKYRHAAVPIINKKGAYVGTMTEGDLLYNIKNRFNFDLSRMSNLPLTKIQRKRDYQSVKVNAKVEDLFNKALTQNFVPVIDDDNIFIGIVKRKDIMEYLCKQV